RFMNREGATIRAIAIAGVGRSTLGTAALARNVADALGIDVAGIITGYGVSDVMTEALGGWVAFGAPDRIRHTIEKFFDRLPGDNEVSTCRDPARRTAQTRIARGRRQGSARCEEHA